MFFFFLDGFDIIARFPKTEATSGEYILVWSLRKMRIDWGEKDSITVIKL